jgi:methylmalonyl-CoA carboxyltransferase 1.3S subunit
MKLNITVDGRAYEVEVEVAPPEHPIYGVGGYVPMSPVRVPAPPPAPPLAPPPAAPGAAPGAAPAAPVNEEKACRSPISGIVVRVAAQPGQHIQVGDAVLVLEAMKMETDITAPVAGKIRSITVKVGDSVQGGQVLAEFE